MKATPGGNLPIEEVFGRDEFINQLWETLDRNSIRLEAERRIGKTCVLKKMEKQPRTGWQPIFLDLERVHSAAEFAEVVCQEVQSKLNGWARAGRRIAEIAEIVRGSQIGILRFPDPKARSEDYWKKLLTSAIEDLVEQQHAAGKRVVFLFDELPWMISAISRPDRDGSNRAMEVLDVLRSLRQSPATAGGFRMIQSGSIGLHHALDALRRTGYQNQPVNDMEMIEVPPLAPAIATELANRLIAGEGLQSESQAGAKIAELTGGFPFYIHWMVAQLKRNAKPANIEHVERTLKELLIADHDPCSFRHFQTRLTEYYGADSKFVLAILDFAALADGPLTQRELINVGKSVDPVDDEHVRNLLRLLTIDHYLTRSLDNKYTFRHSLLCRWWRLDRGLGE